MSVWNVALLIGVGIVAVNVLIGVALGGIVFHDKHRRSSA